VTTCPDRRASARAVETYRDAFELLFRFAQRFDRPVPG